MRIFISHSTDKDDATGRQRLNAVDAALKGAPPGHDVLLDIKRLEASFEWRAELDEWMTTCHAAVLLLTPKALESPWVLKEATMHGDPIAIGGSWSSDCWLVQLDGPTGNPLKAF
jgi:hypothetical protein